MHHATMISVPVPSSKIPLLSDQEVVELLRKGNRRAGDALVQRHNRLVAKTVYQLVKDLAAVEDLIQEIFMKAFRKIHLYDPAQGKFTAWLSMVARNEAINHLRKRKRSRHVSIEDTAPEGGFDPGDRPSQKISKKETWGKVIQAIHELPDPQRTIVRERILQSKPFDQIAKTLSQPVDTIKTIYYRCIENIRKKLGIPIP